MNVFASSLIRRSPITVTPETTIHTALETMQRMKIGTVIVVDPESQVPLGIFTLQDVLLRVALPQPGLATPISAVMTAQPVTLNGRATAHQVGLLMARRSLRHVLIVDDTQRLLGIISKNDLYDLLCSSCVSARSAQRKAQAAEEAAARAAPAPAPVLAEAASAGVD